MKNIKVSVIIPVYNVEKYLPECLDSVINQTLHDIEIICVDDGSTDNSSKILDDYAKRDSRIQIITQKNQYLGTARNNGMKVAKGEYLQFLDSDDFFELSMLEEVYNAAKENDADIAIFDAKIYKDGESLDHEILAHDSVPSGVFSRYDNPNVAAFIFQMFNPMPWNKMFKRSFVEQHNVQFSSARQYEDIPFTQYLLAAAHRIIFVPKVFINWRWRDDSLSHQPKNSDGLYRGIHELYNNISRLDDYSQLERSFINHIIDNSSYFYNCSSREDVKVLTAAYIKAFYREFEIGKYPENYFYQPQNYHLFMKLALWNMLPTAI